MNMAYQYTKDPAPVGRRLYVVDTGAWRIQRPVRDEEKCNACGICTLYCPTASILYQEDDITIDLGYCKGCGICATECPRQAIIMVREEAEQA